MQLSGRETSTPIMKSSCKLKQRRLEQAAWYEAVIKYFEVNCIGHDQIRKGSSSRKINNIPKEQHMINHDCCPGKFSQRNFNLNRNQQDMMAKKTSGIFSSMMLLIQQQSYPLGFPWPYDIFNAALKSFVAYGPQINS